MGERIRLSTGFVRAAGYADKIRRTLFALVKGKGVPSQAVVRTAAQVNMRLFDLFREKNVEKTDVVRIIFEFEITDEKGLKIDWQSMTIEVYKYSETIEGVTPPEEMETEQKVAVVGAWREFEFRDDLFKKLKLLADEVRRTDYGWHLAGENFEAEVHDERLIRIKYTGPESGVEEFWSKILLEE